MTPPIRLSESQLRRVRREMDRRKITQQQLAARIGSHQATISSILSGRKLATVDMWRRIVEPLGLDLRVSVSISRRP